MCNNKSVNIEDLEDWKQSLNIQFHLVIQYNQSVIPNVEHTNIHSNIEQSNSIQPFFIYLLCDLSRWT